MIDYDKIYEQEGLLGLMPYAHQRGQDGYKFFIEKFLKDGDFFVYTIPGSGLPCLEINDSNESYIDVFFDMDSTYKFIKLLHPETAIHAIQITHSSKQSVLSMCRDVGVSFIRCNCELLLCMDDLIPVIGYDGYLDGQPLRNAEMRLALHYTTQKAHDKASGDDLVVYRAFHHLLRTSHVIFPMTLDKPKEKVGVTISDDDFYIPYNQTPDGDVVFAMLSEDGFQRFIEDDGVSESIKDLYKHGFLMIAPFSDLVHLVRTDNVSIAIIDYGVSYIITPEHLENIISFDYDKHMSLSVVEEEQEDLSHIPDFLR